MFDGQIPFLFGAVILWGIFCFVPPLHAQEIPPPGELTSQIEHSIPAGPSLQSIPPLVGDRIFERWIAGEFSPDRYRIRDQDSQEVRLQKQRINMALLEDNHFRQLMSEGIATLEQVQKTNARVLSAKLDFETDHRRRIEAIESALKSARESEQIVESQYREGADVNVQQVAEAKYYRIDLELKLLREQQRTSQSSAVSPPLTVSTPEAAPFPVFQQDRSRNWAPCGPIFVPAPCSPHRPASVWHHR